MGDLLTDLSWEQESGSGYLLKGFWQVSGPALEPDRNVSGWVVCGFPYHLVLYSFTRPFLGFSASPLYTQRPCWACFSLSMFRGG